MKKVFVISDLPLTSVQKDNIERSFDDKTDVSFLTTESENKSIKDLENLVVYLNAGHGDFDGKTYHTFQSDGKFYTFTNNNFTAYEGQTNRIFAKLIKEMLESRGAEVVLTYSPTFDTINQQRINIANNHFVKRSPQKKYIWFSLHSNASGTQSSGLSLSPNGIETYSARKSSQASTIASQKFLEILQPIFNKYKIFNRGAKKEDFTELVNTAMPAILIENLFFTNEIDVKLLYSKEYQNDFAEGSLKFFEWYANN